MENKYHPDVAEAFEATHRIGVIVRRDKMKFAAPAGYKARLTGDRELLFIGRTYNAYLLEAELTHLAETFNAEPTHTAWR